LACQYDPGVNAIARTRLIATINASNRIAISFRDPSDAAEAAVAQSPPQPFHCAVARANSM
jgi:hypothetical protein